jgi:hypothetical protein
MTSVRLEHILEITNVTELVKILPTFPMKQQILICQQEADLLDKRGAWTKGDLLLIEFIDQLIDSRRYDLLDELEKSSPMQFREVYWGALSSRSPRDKGSKKLMEKILARQKGVFDRTLVVRAGHFEQVWPDLMEAAETGPDADQIRCANEVAPAITVIMNKNRFITALFDRKK